MGGTDQLVERARVGDARAYNELFERVAARLLAYIEVRLGQRLRERLDPVDILQEAYLEAHRSFARFEPRGAGAFVRWMFRLIDHRIADQADRAGTRKRTAPTPEEASLLASIPALTGPATRAAREEDRRKLGQAMDRLDARARDLLIQHYFEGTSPAEIARSIGQTDRNVRRLLRGAEAALGAALATEATGPVDVAELARETLVGHTREAPPAEPRRLDRFELRERLGQGGVGTVHRAVDTATGAAVAVKLLHVPSPSAVRRFAREVRALLRLDHPNIVRVREAGSADGAPFLVMDLVEGTTLQARLTAGPLAVAEAVEVARGLARALEHAHARGVLHRDVKPQNVLVRPDGSFVLADFGLAKLIDLDASRLSVLGQRLGTEGYCSPEQARGDLDRIGPPSDVYGVGATLFALLTGSPPFAARGRLERLKALLSEPPPPPSSLRSGVPPALDAVCARCLEKEPARRYPTAAALLAALDEALGGT